MDHISTEWDALPTVSMAEELVCQFRRLTTLEADWLRGLAAFDRRLGWQVMGYRSAASWLSQAVGITMVTGREKLRVARVLADGLPRVGNALGQGRISYCQARAICGLPQAGTEVEAALVTAAEAGASVRDLANLVRRARDLLDPDGTNRESEADFEREGLFLTRGLHGSVLGQLELTAEAGDLLWAAIDSVLASETAAGNPVQPVDARASTDLSTGEPRRSPSQRRADALITLINAGLDHLEQQHPGRARTELLVLVDYETLVERAGGTAQTISDSPLTAEQVHRLACDANLRRIVIKGGSELLDVGTRTPSFTRAQRAAMFARDRGCRFPGCNRWFGLHPHHLTPVADGGGTATTNGALHCRPHHHLIHEGGWTVTGHPDHTLWYQPPDGRPAIAGTPPGQLLAA